MLLGLKVFKCRYLFKCSRGLEGVNGILFEFEGVSVGGGVVCVCVVGGGVGGGD